MDAQKEWIINPAGLNLSQIMPDRPSMGNDVSVLLWRVIRVIGLNSILGEEAEMVSYLTGKHIGKMLQIKDVDDLLKQLTDLKVGKLSATVNSPEAVHIAIEECVTCAGISPALGKPLCSLEVGLVTGALETINPGKKVTGVESKCIGGLGDPVCLAECNII